MNSSAKIDWLIPAGLIALGFVPIVAGTLRMIELSGGAEITSDNARFFAAPVPVILHIVCSIVYCGLGAFQFAPGLRSRRPGLHRTSGRILIPCGLVVALSGLWMTQFYPLANDSPAIYDGPFVYAIRLLAGSAMVLSLCLGVAAICRRDIQNHRDWMMRGYALGLGAGTQVITHLPWFLFPSIQGELARTLFMAAGWIINLAVAEWLIFREHRQSSGTRIATSSLDTPGHTMD